MYACFPQCSLTARNDSRSQCSASSSNTSQVLSEIRKWLGLENHRGHLLPSLVIKLHEGQQVPLRVWCAIFTSVWLPCLRSVVSCRYPIVSVFCASLAMIWWRSKFRGMVDLSCIYTCLVVSPEINLCWIRSFPASSYEKSSQPWHHPGMTRPQQWSSPASSPGTLGFRRLEGL